MFLGFYTAVSGLQAAQRQLDTASHNVSNADTPGYSRQVVDQTEAQPQGNSGSFNAAPGPGMVGRGVTISQISRVRDQFIDNQVRAESAPLGESQVKSDTLKQIEDVFGEPSDNAMSGLLTKFFDSWHDLSADPANKAVRTDLRQQAMNLAAGFQNLYQKLNGLRQDLNDRIGSEIKDINSLSSQIAGLNHEIKAALASGQQPNDLKDQQDLLIEKLSQKCGIQAVTSASNGGTSVYLGGQPLVADEQSFNLTAAPTLLNGLTVVTYAPTGQPATLTGGELKGLVDSRDTILSDTNPQGFIKQINDLASGIMASVNALHTIGFGPTGVTSQTFFDGTDASDMVVNANIVNDTALANGLDVIAAAANDPGSLAGGVGDSQIAIQIAQLRNTNVMTGGTQTFDSFYKNVVTALGTQAQEETRKSDTAEALVKSVKDRRDQVSGVSTDEEMANVVRFQKAYAASARIISTLDSMMDTLVNLGK